MHMFRLVPTFMLFMLLSGQVLFLPGQANAMNCCPCSNPCKAGCQCRAAGTHCSLCRAGDSGFFHAQAEVSTPASSFNAAYEPPSFTLPTTDLSDGILPLVRGGNRTIGDLTIRLLASAEFRIKSWCPESIDKSV
jgi:hypothetical protein